MNQRSDDSIAGDAIGMLAGVIGGAIACALCPWLLIPAALLGLAYVALSERPVLSFLARLAWRAIGYALWLGLALWAIRFFSPH